MIAQRDLMMSFNQAAQLVSEDFAIQLPNAMQYLSRVSASTGRDMSFLMDSLVTGVGRLSPMILDNLSVQVSLAQATERASEMFGVEADALDQAQVQMGMMNVVMEQLEENTASMPDVTNSAAARLERLRATFQNVKDQIGMAFLPTLNNLMMAFSKMVESVLPPVVAFIENTLAPAFRTIAGLINDFFWLVGLGDSPLDALRGALEMAFGDDVADRVMNVVDSIAEFVERVAMAVQPVIDWVSENVRLGDVLLVLGAAIASVVLPALWSVITAVAPVIAIFIAAVGAIALLRSAWENDFLGIRTAVTEAWEGAIKPALQQLWQWLQVNVPAAIQTLSEFWSGTLQPAMMAVWGWVQGTVIPLVSNLWGWLQEKVPMAIQTLSAFWTGTLLPAIQAAIGFFQSNVVPVLSTVAGVISSVLGAAVATLSAYWQNILLPALQAVWGFIQGSIIPLFNAVAEVAGAVLGKAIEALAGLWQNVLQPALSAVWGVIENNILPVFQKVADFVKENIGPVLEQLGNAILPPIQGAFEGISGAIETVVGWLGDLAERIRNIELPDWLTPGSPTPFEIGLRGIGEAMRELSRVRVPSLSAELRQMYEVEAVGQPEMIAVGAGGGGVSWQGNIIIDGARDPQATADATIRALEDRGIIPRTRLR
jgi:hypothetical protein